MTGARVNSSPLPPTKAPKPEAQQTARLTIVMPRQSEPERQREARTVRKTLAI